MPSGIYNVQPRSMTQSIKDWSEIDDAKQRRQINALALQDRQRGIEEATAIQNAMAGLAPDATPEQAAAVLRRVGPGGWAKADVIEKNAAERQKAAALMREQEIKARELETKKAVEDIKVFNYYMNAVSADPRPEVLDAAVSEIEKRTGQPFPLGGLLKKHAADPQMLAKTAHSWALEAEKRLPKEFSGSTGKFDIKGLYDPVSGADVGQPRVFEKSVDPNTAATLARQSEADAERARHNRAIEGKDTQDRSPKPVDIIDPANTEQMIKVDANTWNPQTRVGLIGIAGKEPGAALRKGKVEQGQQQAADIIDSLRAAYQTLDKNRAIPSTERSGASNLSSALAATSLGQMLGRATGTENQVERDVVNSSRLQLLNAIKQSTGMSAQQLNSNVELQLWIKAVTDPSQSYQAVDRILSNIEKFIASGGKYSERKAAGSIDKASGPAPVTKPPVLRFDAQGNQIK